MAGLCFVASKLCSMSASHVGSVHGGQYLIQSLFIAPAGLGCQPPFAISSLICLSSSGVQSSGKTFATADCAAHLY